MASLDTPYVVPNDIPFPIFPVPLAEDTAQVPDTFAGTVTGNIVSSSALLEGPWVSGGAVVSGGVYTYNGNFYKNLTGTNTTTAPPSDTTNWAQVYNFSVGVGTPTATGLTTPPNLPDAGFGPPPWLPPYQVAAYASGTTYAAGALVYYNNAVWSSVAGGNIGHTPVAGSTYWTNIYGVVSVGTWAPSFDTAAELPAYNSGTTYPLNAVVKYGISVSPWAVGTAYTTGQLVSLTTPDGASNAYIFQAVQGSTGKNPFDFGNGASWQTAAEDLDGAIQDDQYWLPVATYNDFVSGTTYYIAFQSLANGNVGNTPAAGSAYWAVVASEDAKGITREGGPLTYPSLQYANGTETEVWTTNGYFGGGTTTTITRVDANRAVGPSGSSLVVSPTSLSFAHTTNGTSTATVKTPDGTTRTPGSYIPPYGLIPPLVVTSSNVAIATVSVVQSTGVITVTGVAAGSCNVTVTCGSLSVVIPVTLS